MTVYIMGNIISRPGPGLLYPEMINADNLKTARFNIGFILQKHLTFLKDTLKTSRLVGVVMREG
jgi:hypothetical protein